MGFRCWPGLGGGEAVAGAAHRSALPGLVRRRLHQVAGIPAVDDYEWGPAGRTPPEAFQLPQVPPWLGRAIRWALDARRLVWPVLFGLPGQDDDEVNTRNLYRCNCPPRASRPTPPADVWPSVPPPSLLACCWERLTWRTLPPPPSAARRASDGIKIWDNFWSLSLVNFGLYSGDIGLFTWESPYMVLGGSGLTRSIVEPGWSDTAPVYFSGFNLFLGPIIGQSSNTALARVRLFPSLGLDRLGVPTPPEAPPGYAPRPSFVPPGFMGFSPFEFNVFDRSFFALVEDVLGSL